MLVAMRTITRILNPQSRLATEVLSLDMPCCAVVPTLHIVAPRPPRKTVRTDHSVGLIRWSTYA